MLCRQKRTHLNPGPAKEPGPQPKPQPPPRRSHQTPGSCLGYFKDKKKDEKSIHHSNKKKDEECIHHKMSVTNFKKSLEFRLKQAIMLRHLSTGEPYTSWQYHWLVGSTTICKFAPQGCQAILTEFQDKYLHCPTDPEYWKKLEAKVRTRWNVLHGVGTIDGKHITMKKSSRKKSGTDYYNN